MHHPIHTRPWWSRAALVVAMICGLLASFSAREARAGVAEIRQCHGAGDELLDGGPNGGYIEFAGCGAAGSASLLSSGAAGATAPIAFRNLTFTAPGHTTFVGGRLYRQMHNYVWYGGSAAPSWAYGYVLTDSTGATLESCGFSAAFSSGDCFTNASLETVFTDDHIDLPTHDASTFTLTVGCAKVGYCHHFRPNPGVDGVAAEFRVRDDVPPSPTAATGALATAAVIHTGDTSVTLGASDADGLGVYDARLLVDDSVVGSETFSDNGGRCVDMDPSGGGAWTSGQPCPVSAAVRSFSFADLPEGAHNLKLQVRDAALNETLAFNRDVTIDLVPAPSLTSSPVISGTPRTGKSLTADPGVWDGHGRAVTFTYKWLRCDAAGAACVDTGTSGAGHEADAADAYHSLVAEITATSDEGGTTVRTAPTSVVRDAQDRVSPPAGAQESPTTGTNHAAAGGGSNTPAQAAILEALRGTANGDNPSDSARLDAVFSSTGKRSLRIAYGKRPVLRGRLTGPSGAGISNARIELLSTLSMRGAKAVDKGGARTRKDGSWTLILPRDLSSRTLTLRYRSHQRDAHPAAQATLKLSVAAGLTLDVTPRSSHNHGTIHFAGRVLGHSIPRNGKVVELQARGKGHTRWITFKTVRSTRGGSVRAKYTFHSSSSVSYQFRARARAESGYPYLTGASRKVTIHVR